MQKIMQSDTLKSIKEFTNSEELLGQVQNLQKSEMKRSWMSEHLGIYPQSLWRSANVGFYRSTSPYAEWQGYNGEWARQPSLSKIFLGHLSSKCTWGIKTLPSLGSGFIADEKQADD